MGAARSLEKLTNIMGAEKAADLIAETMRSAGVVRLDDPNDLFRFAEALMKHGGVIEAVGRAIKIQALLAGASLSSPPTTARRKIA